MKKAVVLFALAACALLVRQDRAIPATSNPLNISGHAFSSPLDGTGPIPLCTPQCPVMVNR